MASPKIRRGERTGTEMTDEPNSDLRKQRLTFLAKAAVVLGILFLLSRTAPIMPVPCLALCWAALSAALTVTAVYHLTIRKAHRQTMYKSGGWLGRINSGRLLGFLVGFVLSAFCVGCLIMESPKWDAAEWCVIVLSAPLYLLVSHGVGKFVKAELKDEYQISRTATMSSVIVALLLCVAYALVNALLPAPEYASLEEALRSVKRPFDNSPSALMSEAGQYVAFSDGLTAYGLGKAGEASFPTYVALKIVLSASALFSVAGLMDLCFLNWRELRKAFQPLWASRLRKRNPRLVRRFVAIAAILPICLVVAFCVADYRTSEVIKTEGYSAAESFIQQQSEVLVYLIDGHYYDAQAVEALRAEAEAAAQNLRQEAKEKLTPLINASYDARIANVDSYLDWYYSPAADIERFKHMTDGSTEEFVKGMFTEKIEAGIDDSELKAAIESYSEQANALQQELTAKLAEYEVTDVPESVMVVKGSFDNAFQETTLEPSQKLMAAHDRFMLSGVTGLGAGIAIDFLTLKADELLNRGTYREEIIAAIEESRAETLALLDS